YGVRRLALVEPPLSRHDLEMPDVVLDSPVRDHVGRSTLHLEALEDAPVAARVMGLGAARAAPARVVDDEIGVRAHGDGALPRIEPEDAGGVRAAQSHHALEVEAALAHPTRVQELETVLDPRR